MLLTNNNFQDLPVRVFSAVVFGILAISSIVSGGLIFTLFLSSSVAIITWEIFNIFNGGTLTIVNSRLIIPVMMFFVPFFQYYNFYPLTVLVLVASTTVIFKEGRWLKSLCIFYIGVSVLTCQSLLFTSSEIPSFYHLLLVLTVVAGSDIGGYFFGRIIGGTKIYESVSPNKTWAGSIGGVALGVCICLVSNPLFQYSWIEMVFLGFLLSTAAQVGDFFESFLKRRFKVKDSGFILPGHGGLYDRLDGVLAAVPVYSGILFFF